jgi:hypothetical protein
LRWAVLGVYALLVVVILIFVGRNLGTDIFRRLMRDKSSCACERRPDPIERTEEIALKALDVISAEAGKPKTWILLSAMSASSPPAFPVNTIHQWSSGPHEAVLQIALKHGLACGSPNCVSVCDESSQRRCRHGIVIRSCRHRQPDHRILDRRQPIEVASADRISLTIVAYAQKLRDEMSKIPSFRDVQFGQPLDYPTVRHQHRS